MAKKKPQTIKTPKLVFIGAFVPETVKAAVEIYAANEGRTVSSTVRRILENAAGVKSLIQKNGSA